MTIGIDIDYVITDTERYIKEEGSKYFEKEVVNPCGETTVDIFELTPEHDHQFWLDRYKDYCKNCPIRTDADKVTHNFHQKGYKIVIVTARFYRPEYGFSSEEEYFDTIKTYLTEKGIYFDEFCSVPRPKLQAISKYDIDFFIDDDPYNLATLKNFTKTIILDTNRNKNYDDPKVFRATDWLEVERLIEENK